VAWISINGDECSWSNQRELTNKKSVSSGIYSRARHLRLGKFGRTSVASGGLDIPTSASGNRSKSRRQRSEIGRMGVLSRCALIGSLSGGRINASHRTALHCTALRCSALLCSAKAPELDSRITSTSTSTSQRAALKSESGI